MVKKKKPKHEEKKEIAKAKVESAPIKAAVVIPNPPVQKVDVHQYMDHFMSNLSAADRAARAEVMRVRGITGKHPNRVWEEAMASF